MMCNASNAIPGFRYLTFANQDARLYGVDITGFRHLGSSETLGDFSLRAVASYINGENDTTGDNLYNIMPLNATFSLEHSRRDWTNVLEWQLVSAKDNTSEVRNEVQTGGYGLLNARSSYVWHDLRMDLGVDNMFDRGYDLPLGGAYVGQGETMSPAGVPWELPCPVWGVRSIWD